MKRCIYCKTLILEGSVIDFCDDCGYKVFGEKMLNVIKKNMERARERGDLFQGSCTLDENSNNERANPQKPCAENWLERKPFK